MQVQKTEATRRELGLQCDALAQKETNLLQRETSFEQTRVKHDEALLSSRQAVAAMEAQMHTQQQESARLLSGAEAEVRRLRKALEEAVASKEALREKSAMELGAKQRAADEAEERHLAQERRLLSEIDRERMATRHANAELTKEQKARAADLEAGREAMASSRQEAQDLKAAHRHAAITWSRQQQEAQVELATLRERAAGAEQRTTDLTSQLERQQEQSEREISQLRDSHATTSAALRHLQDHAKGNETPPPSRARKSSK